LRCRLIIPDGFIVQRLLASVSPRPRAGVSCLNRRHMLWAWSSLVSVAFSDLYVRMCSMGVWSD